MNETASGSTEPARVHIEPLTTLVVIPAVDGTAAMGISTGCSAVISGVTLLSLFIALLDCQLRNNLELILDLLIATYGQKTFTRQTFDQGRDKICF